MADGDKPTSHSTSVGVESSVSGPTGYSFGRGRGCGRDSALSGRGRDSGFGGRDSGVSTRGGHLTGGGGRGRGRGSRLCRHCGRTNHIVETCYDLHGFPHAHQVAAFEDGPLPSQTDTVVTISAEEYQRLVSNQTSSSTATLAQTSPSVACVASSHSSNPWVIDSGASDHMTGTSTILSSRQPVGTPSRVTLADGSTTEVTGLGSVSVTSSLTLDSVLHVPRFPFNLLSVSKLTKSLNCSVTFSPHGCVFQDLKTGRKIGGGTEHGGLYYLINDSHPKTVALHSSVSPYQHHCRL